MDKIVNGYLTNLEFKVSDANYVFAKVTDLEDLPSDVDVAMSMREEEGTTVVLDSKSATRLDTSVDADFKMISLSVETPLALVGFMFQISKVFTKYGIASNAVCGFHHDHFFVPVAQLDDAVNALNELRNDAMFGRSACACA